MTAKLKQFIVTLCIIGISLPVYTADLVEVLPVTHKIIRLTFDEGYIKNRGTGNDQTMKWSLNLKDATNLESYFIISPDDPDYGEGRKPTDLGRKSKIHDVNSVCDWNGQKCMNDYIQYHYVYLKLPEPLKDGHTYTLKVADLADNSDEWDFKFNIKNENKIRSVAVHTNHMGYSTRAEKKYAYVSQWMGKLGGLNIDGYEQVPFYIYPVQSDGSLGESVYTGSIQKQKDYETGGPDSDRSKVGPKQNFVKSDVWECDFSDFNTPGEYVIGIDSIGCSYPFRIHEDAYHEAFYYACRALYFERAITELPEQYAGKYKRPEWDERKLVYTSVRTMDLTDESGSNQKQKIFDNLDYSFDLSNIHGWYHDAGDWDGYYSHFKVPRLLMTTYELAPENFGDGELNIPEAQAKNGYSNTHIPDILDEGVWLVDYFKNNVGPTGGRFGSRVHPDISTKDGLDDPSRHEDMGFVFEEEDNSPNTSFNDYRTWIVHGEDPRDSYAFASIASQYAYCLKIAENHTGEDYSAIIQEYRDSAISAYNWANNNVLPGDWEKTGGSHNSGSLASAKVTAATWLYKLTGEQQYHAVLDTTLTEYDGSSSNIGNVKWAVWAYTTIDGSDPLYDGTFDTQLQTDLIKAVENYAYTRVMESIEDKNRSMRMGGSFYQPIHNGQATTPWITAAMVAHKVTGSQDYLNACYFTGDYFLGGNQMNYTWLTGLGHQHPIHILHVDSREDDIYGNIPGVPPYSPRVLCDWMSYQGNNCEYGGPWDNDFFLLDGRIYPPYHNNNGETQWPVHELWFDQYTSPPGAEFTIHQTIGPAAAAYGFLSGKNANSTVNKAPSVEISIPNTEITEGDELEIQVNAQDNDGWIYTAELYQNNRLVKKIRGNTSFFIWENVPGGPKDIHVKVTDNMGQWSTSDTLNIGVKNYANAPEINFNMESDTTYGFAGNSFFLDVEVGGDVDTVIFYSYFKKIGSSSADPYDIEWTPGEEGDYKIRAVAKDKETGLSAQAKTFISLKDTAYLAWLSVSEGTLSPKFSGDVYDYTVELPHEENFVPELNYRGVEGSTVSVQSALGIDQRVYVDKEDRTSIIRVEEEGNPANFTEYRVTFSLALDAPPLRTDTLLFEHFGNEDNGFQGLASEYTKFSSDSTADFIDDSVSINEWWQVAPKDKGASGEAKVWLTNLSDDGDTLHFTNIDISDYSNITGLSWWSFANTGWGQYFSKAPAVEISVDGGEFKKLFIPGEVEESKFDCQSKWGKLNLSIDEPLNGSKMTFRVGTYDDQQWMIDDILLTTDIGECYATLSSLSLSEGKINYDPDKTSYEVELSSLEVPEVSYTPTDENAEVTVDSALSVSQVTHPYEGDRTTTITVQNCGTKTTYSILFTSSLTAYLSSLSASTGSLTPEFESDIYNYTVELPPDANELPELNYSAPDGNTVSVQEARGIDQRVFVEEESRTSVIRVEQDGNPDNYAEYEVTFRLDLDAPPLRTDTLLFEHFGNEDSGFNGLAKNYTKFSSDSIADFVDDSVSINEFWQVAPKDSGATGEARIWMTTLSDDGDTLHFTNIDIKDYSAITGLSWWSLANTDWNDYYTRAPAVEISIDGDGYKKLYEPGEIEESEFDCMSKWGKLDLSLDIPLNGSRMTFRIGTYDNQQWLIDDIILKASTGECFATLKSLSLSEGSINYDPDTTKYQVVLSSLEVPEVSYAPSNEEAEVAVENAVSVSEETHPDEADRTTTITVQNCGKENVYSILFTTTAAVGIDAPELKDLRIYPNPVNDEIKIESPEKVSRVEIYNTVGSLVQTLSTNKDRNVQLDVSGLNSGIYLIKVFNDEKLNGMGKFTKE
jgi:hypothetical protein